MKAIRVHGPKDLRYEEVPDPKIKPDEVLIKVKAAAVCGTDVEVYDGTMFYITSGMAKLPFTPGHEWSGEVVELGSDVSEFEVGDKVTGECSVGCRTCHNCLRGWYNQCATRRETGLLGLDGGFAEYIAFPKYFLHKCNGMKFDEASFIEPTGVALYPTKLAHVCPEDYVAVFGPGPIGLFMVQTAKVYGAKKVILIGTREDRLALGKKAFGADETVNVRTENLVEKVKAVTGGHMIDVALEAVGKPSVWDDIASVIAPRGRIAMTGLFAGEKCHIDFDPLVIGNVTIMGTLGGPNVWDEAISLHERGLVKAGPMISHRLPLSEFKEAMDILKERRDNALKIVLEP